MAEVPKGNGDVATVTPDPAMIVVPVAEVPKGKGDPCSTATLTHPTPAVPLAGMPKGSGDQPALLAANPPP